MSGRDWSSCFDRSRNEIPHISSRDTKRDETTLHRAKKIIRNTMQTMYYKLK